MWASCLILDSVLKNRSFNKSRGTSIWKVPESSSCSRCRWAIHPSRIRVAKCFISSFGSQKKNTSLATTSCSSWIIDDRNTPACGVKCNKSYRNDIIFDIHTGETLENNQQFPQLYSYPKSEWADLSIFLSYIFWSIE